MNPKSIFKLFNLKGKAQAVVHQGVSTLIISSVALSLVILTGYARIVRASGPETSGQPSIEALRNIDPADRKFFTPGYGAQRGMSSETEVLPTAGVEPHTLAWPPRPTQFMADNAVTSLDETAIDPADRKFFTPGYGVNTGGNDLTAYHQSEWDRTPNTGLGVEENALAAYHQSEQDRTPNAELGAVENALTEYHQSEWGRTQSPVLGTEALSKIDPADQKFFNPGYGAQTISDNGVEAILSSNGQ